MSCIVYQTDKKTGVKYAYESTSYWDKDKKQPRSKRKYIGKVDPETGEIISSRRRKNIPANTDNDQNHTYLAAISQLQEDLLEKESQIRQLQTDLTELSVKYNKAEKLFAEIVSSVNTFKGQIILGVGDISQGNQSGWDHILYRPTIRYHGRKARSP